MHEKSTCAVGSFNYNVNPRLSFLHHTQCNVCNNAYLLGNSRIPAHFRSRTHHTNIVHIHTHTQVLYNPDEFNRFEIAFLAEGHDIQAKLPFNLYAATEYSTLIFSELVIEV